MIAFHLFSDRQPGPALPASGLTLDAVPGETVEPDGVGGFFSSARPTDSGAHSLRRLLPDGGAIRLGAAA